ncbi:MAG: methionine synthase [Desulfurococcaceae archaeon]
MYIRTSHVGSFPLSYTIENVARVMRDMANIGLDAPSYPQLRSFIEIYLDPLVTQGMLRRERDLFIASRSLPESFNAELIKVSEAEIAINIARSENLKFKWLRAPVTGAFTLASRVYLHEDTSRGIAATALSNKDIVRNFFAELVRESARYLSNLGYNVVFLDEPFLTLVIGRKRLLFDYKAEDIIETLDYIVKPVSGEVGIHICGQLHRGLIEIIAQVPRIKFISVELHDIPENLEVVDKSILEKYDKILSPGVVSAKKPVVEEIEDVLNVLRKAHDKTSGRIDLVSGDCGFRGLRGSIGQEEQEYLVSISKLNVLVKAVKYFEKTL